LEDSFKDFLLPIAIEKRGQQIHNMSATEKQLVAKDGEKIVGLIRLIKRENVNQLQSIYILPEYQRKGIGIKLWKEGLKWFVERKPIIVHVATYNTQAISFYSKLKFKDSGKRFTEERMRMKNGVIIPEMEMTNEDRMLER
jgi:ribosomal protein S18 acetylase RimI-like enzyme